MYSIIELYELNKDKLELLENLCIFLQKKSKQKSKMAKIEKNGLILEQLKIIFTYSMDLDDPLIVEIRKKTFEEDLRLIQIYKKFKRNGNKEEFLNEIQIAYSNQIDYNILLKEFKDNELFDWYYIEKVFFFFYYLNYLIRKLMKKMIKS